MAPALIVTNVQRAISFWLETSDGLRSNPIPNLLCARRYAAALAEFRNADDSDRSRLQQKMDDLLEVVNQKSGGRSQRESSLASDIRGNVREREPLSRTISGSKAEAIRYFYAIPPAPLLNTLLGAEFISLGDLFEGWAQDDRLDPRTMIELLGWSDGCAFWFRQ